MGIIFSVIGIFMILYMAACNRRGNEPETGGTGILATVLGTMGIIIMVFPAMLLCRTDGQDNYITGAPARKNIGKVTNKEKPAHTA